MSKSKVEIVTNFVKQYFRLYDLNPYGFFCVYDDEEDQNIEIDLFYGKRFDEDTLSRISSRTGLSKEEILNADKDSFSKYFRKFPFLSYYFEYIEKCEWYSQFKNEQPSEMDRLINAIYGKNYGDGIGFSAEERYSTEDVSARLMEKIKEMDKCIPGTYHANATITNLSITTESFFSYPNCSEMLRTFLDMVSTLTELFFKAIDSGLTADEELEYNFLASFLEVQDTIVPSDFLTYNKVRKHADVYKKEGYDDFFEYAKINRLIKTSPWRCIEFFNDTALVQSFVTIFPQSKAMMREFAQSILNYVCWFIWSDAEPEEEPEEESRFWNRMFPDEEHKVIQEPTVIYVKKNSDETAGWNTALRKLEKAARPAKIGGLKLPPRATKTIDASERMQRMHRRINANWGGGN